jgi:hypothetical protein
MSPPGIRSRVPVQATRPLKTASSRAAALAVSAKPTLSPAMISTVSSRSERIAIRGVKVAKPISSTWPTGSGDADCEANFYSCRQTKPTRGRDALAAAQSAQLPALQKFFRLGERQPLLHDGLRNIGGPREREPLAVLLHLELETLGKAA